METRVGRDVEWRTQPQADAAIRHLVDADCRVVLLGGGGADTDGAEVRYPGVEVAETLPSDARGWLVTADEGRCAAARDHHGLKTILIGPTQPDRGLASRISDRDARDLIDAALIILAADAMPEPAPIIAG